MVGPGNGAKQLALLVFLLVFFSTTLAQAVTISVATWPEFKAALDDPAVPHITLTADIEVPADASGFVSQVGRIHIQRTVTIDGGGYRLNFLHGELIIGYYSQIHGISTNDIVVRLENLSLRVWNPTWREPASAYGIVVFMGRLEADGIEVDLRWEGATPAAPAGISTHYGASPGDHLRLGWTVEAEVRNSRIQVYSNSLNPYGFYASAGSTVTVTDTDFDISRLDQDHRIQGIAFGSQNELPEDYWGVDGVEFLFPNLVLEDNSATGSTSHCMMVYRKNGEDDTAEAQDIIDYVLAENSALPRVGILLPDFAEYPYFLEGQGTLADPWQISTPSQLSNIRFYLGQEHADKHFELINDIDLDVAPYNAGEGWTPLGTYVGWENPDNKPFSGTLDGNSHTISGLFIHRTENDMCGLFGLTSGATIQNLQMAAVDISSGYYAGAIAGMAYDTELTDTYSSGTVTAGTRGGGLVGEAYDSRIADSGSSSTVTVTNGTNAGGLLGQMTGTRIENSYATGNASATQDLVGGLVGEARNSSVISNCYATGSVTGDAEIGGLVGYLAWDSSIENSYATGLVDGGSSWRVGGLVGHIYSNSTIRTSFAAGRVIGGNQVGGLVGSVDDTVSSISDSFATGQVTASENIGGLVGFNKGKINRTYAVGRVITQNGVDTMGGLVGSNESLGTIEGEVVTIIGEVSDSYWDINSSGQAESAAGEGRTTSEMQKQGTFADWSFTGVWQMVEEVTYPYLNWQPFVTTTPTLLAPLNETNLENSNPTLAWLPVLAPAGREIVRYQIQVATNSGFSGAVEYWVSAAGDVIPASLGLAALLLSGGTLVSGRRRVAVLIAGVALTALLINGCGGSSSSDRDPVAEPQTEALTLALQTLEDDTTYYWRVRALDDQDQWSEWSQEWSFTTAGIL